MPNPPLIPLLHLIMPVLAQTIKSRVWDNNTATHSLKRAAAASVGGGLTPRPGL